MIKLEVKERPVMKIGTAEKENKYVLQLAKGQTVDDKEVVEFCHNHTQIPTVYIKAAAESYCQTIMHYLLMGYRVKVGDLGTFFLALDTKAAGSIDEAGLDQLMDIRVRFRPTKEFATKIRQAEVKLDGIFKLVDAERKIYEKVPPAEAKGKKKASNKTADKTESAG